MRPEVIGAGNGRIRIQRCEGHQESAGTLDGASVMDLPSSRRRHSQNAALGDSAADGTAQQRPL
jgi:hypothetical protein